MRWGEAPQPAKDPTQADLCAEWLVDELGEEPEGLTPKELEQRAKPDWSRRTMHNARDLLGDRIVEVGPAGPGRRWKLAE